MGQLLNVMALTLMLIINRFEFIALKLFRSFVVWQTWHVLLSAAIMDDV